MARIIITQPYVPAYRAPLFDELAQLLQGEGHGLTVYSGVPKGEQALRGDAATGEWHRLLGSRNVRLRGRQLEMRRLPSEARSADLLISELSGANILAWQELRRVPTVLWGHGKSYVTEPSPLGERLKGSLARRAAHVMTYSESGREHLIRHARVPADRVTAIGNSTDTGALRAAVLSEPNMWDPSQPHTALYVGGIDAPKRIDFLLAAYDAAKRLDPGFRLIVVGTGARAGEVEARARQDSSITYVAEARGAALATLASRAQVMWVPGRVGLVAVDALALGLPVHTTCFRYHAPEIEFLRGDEVAFLDDEPRGFARESLLEMSRLAMRGRVLRQDIPSVGAVAQAMAAVIAGVLR